VLADWFPLKFDKRFGGETEEAITGRIFVEVCAHPCVGPGFRCSSKHAFSPSLRPQDAGTGYAGALGCERAWRGQIEYEGAIAEAATTPAALSHAASRLTAAETGQIMEVGPRSPSCDKRRPG
jgi:hypothetical protein